MNTSSDFAGKRIAVIGLAATGLATSRVLMGCGARSITVYDRNEADALSPERIFEARKIEGVTLALGTDAVDWSVVDLVIPSPGVPRRARPLVDAVERGVPVMGEIEAAYRLAKAPILAVTGTNGKTTTTALLGAICRAAGLKTWIAGNIAEDAGVRLPLIEAAVDAPADGVIVAEISSFQLEWVTTFRPRAAAWLNLSPDHLDRHADMDEYARAKSNIFRAQTPDDFAILNDDDSAVVRYADGIGHASRVLFGLTRKVWTDSPAQPCVYLDGQRIMAERLGAEAETQFVLDRNEIGIPGRHNAANVLAAAAMALAFGIDIGAVRAAVRGFRGVAHRMERVAVIGGVRYVNNSMCTNPAAVEASLDAVDGPVIAISGGRHKVGDLSGMAGSLHKYARHAILIGEAAPAIGSLLNAAGGPPHAAADSLREAVLQASEIALPGDTVLLVPGCASFDMFTSFEHRGQVFRDAVKELTL